METIRKVILLTSCFAMLFCNNLSAQFRTARKINAEKKEVYDAIIIPGAPYDDHMDFIIRARMLWAKHLYDNGQAKNIIFSGASVYSPYVEAEIMKIYADTMGIPSENTFAETKAEHSTENIFYSVKMAKEMGFEKIAIATDHLQAMLLLPYIYSKFPEIDVVLIKYKQLDALHEPLPEIDPCAAYDDEFVALPEREHRGKRMMGSLGMNIESVEKPRTEEALKIDLDSFFNQELANEQEIIE